MHYFNTPKGPKFIMLVGLPCSGKSTWLKDFVETDINEWVVLSTDNIYEAYAVKKEITYDEAFDALPNKKVNAKFQLSKTVAFKNRDNIIWDQTNVYPNARRKKLASLPKKDYEAIALVFEIDRAEIDRRLAVRFAETGKSVPAKSVDEMAENYLRPSTSEGFSKVHLISQ